MLNLVLLILRIRYNTLCIISNTLCIRYNTLCIISNTLCIRYNTLCIISNTLCIKIMKNRLKNYNYFLFD